MLVVSKASPIHEFFSSFVLSFLSSASAGSRAGVPLFPMGASQSQPPYTPAPIHYQTVSKMNYLHLWIQILFLFSPRGYGLESPLSGTLLCLSLKWKWFFCQ